MSITRLKSTSKTPRKSLFTMVELIAVISITAILLTITINIMKTDSTKANAQIIGSALSYAQSYALSQLSSADDDGDGFADEYVMVIIDKDANNLTIKKFDSGDNSVDEIIREEVFAAGSTLDNNYLIGFRSKGDPITTSTTPPSLPVTLPLSLSTISTQVTVTISDNKNAMTYQVVRVKPFTGKVTYY